MATEKEKAEGLRRQKLACAAIVDALAPLIDGQTVIGIECIVLVADGERLGTSRMVLGRTAEAQSMMAAAAASLHAGEIPVAEIEELALPIAPRN